MICSVMCLLEIFRSLTISEYRIQKSTKSAHWIPSYSMSGQCLRCKNAGQLFLITETVFVRRRSGEDFQCVTGTGNSYIQDSSSSTSVRFFAKERGRSDGRFFREKPKTKGLQMICFLICFPTTLRFPDGLKKREIKSPLRVFLRESAGSD